MLRDVRRKSDMRSEGRCKKEELLTVQFFIYLFASGNEDFY